MKWCQSCVLPETRPNLRIGANGVCNACTNHSTKKDIDWVARRKQLEAVATSAKRRARKTSYDCLIPVSGGKDSTWQTVQCLEMGLRPLAVTWKSPGRTQIGRSNLENLVSLGVDHIDWQVSPRVEAKFMLKTFESYGSTAIPMHMALFNIPLNLAVRFGIPLVVWGENSAFEYGAAADEDMGFALDARWLRTYGVTQGTSADDWVSDSLTAKELAPYFGPSPDQMAEAGVRAIFLGHYLPWDPQETMRIASQHGFVADSSGPRTGFYDFADIDDDFISIHHWMKWYKFGFTRLFDNLSIEIRNGRITRDNALGILGQLGSQTPFDDIRKFCAFADIHLKDFFAIAERFRNSDLWSLREDGVWFIPDFLVADWPWSEGPLGVRGK
jgi:N-acetyl sugar amidotransferase